MNRRLIFLIFLSIAFSCNDNPVDIESPTDDFSLLITVKDDANNSISNLKVNAWNKLPYDNYLIPKIQKAEGTQSGTTTFLFALKEKSYVNLFSYDL